ncbi:hypothetical protein [Amycolatopsis sp. NPDC098790]|uniref:hypothetical protein n=1 Tax=Amycolatopsis sp. NPDC098790 TaxID=3363939 RepID=UPI0037FAA4CB
MRAVLAQQGGQFPAVAWCRRDQRGEELSATRVFSRLFYEVQQQVEAVIDLFRPVDKRAAPLPAVQPHLDFTTVITYNKHMMATSLNSNIADNHGDLTAVL